MSPFILYYLPNCPFIKLLFQCMFLYDVVTGMHHAY